MSAECHNRANYKTEIQVSIAITNKIMFLLPHNMTLDPVIFITDIIIINFLIRYLISVIKSYDYIWLVPESFESADGCLVWAVLSAAPSRCLTPRVAELFFCVQNPSPCTPLLWLTVYPIICNMLNITVCDVLRIMIILWNKETLFSFCVMSQYHLGASQSRNILGSNCYKEMMKPMIWSV